MHLARIEAPSEKFAIQSYTAHLTRIELVVGGEVAHPFVSPFYLPGLNGPKSTAHEYLSFSCLLCPSNEGSRCCPVWLTFGIGLQTLPIVAVNGRSRDTTADHGS